MAGLFRACQRRHSIPTFIPPAELEGPAFYGDRLGEFFKMAHGVTILKHPNGTYEAGRYFGPDVYYTASTVYHGGHRYQISDAEAAALTAAGFGAYIQGNPGDVYVDVYVDDYGPGPGDDGHATASAFADGYSDTY